MGVTFSSERLRRLAQLEGWHFWFVGRRALVQRLLDRHLGGNGQLALDVGCGTGAMLNTLAPRFHRIVGIDLNPEGLHNVRRESADAILMRANATRLPITDNVFGAVLLLDVLEHVDDHAALAEVHRVLRPGGVAVITVPAVRWLWSYRDEAAGHLRRYGRRQLVEAITGARLAVLAVQYYQCLLFPFVAVTRLLGRGGAYLRDLEDRPSQRLSRLLAWVNLTEVRLGEVIPWPWGSSLVAVCRKAAA